MSKNFKKIRKEYKKKLVKVTKIALKKKRKKAPIWL